MNGSNGAKIFRNVSYEQLFDKDKSRPKMRMLTEVRKVCELFIQLKPFIDEFDIEVHLDINQDPKHGSNCAAQEAAGYVLGVTGLPENQIKFKPDAPAASFGSDWVVNKGSKNTKV